MGTAPKTISLVSFIKCMGGQYFIKYDGVEAVLQKEVWEYTGIYHNRRLFREALSNCSEPRNKSFILQKVK